MKNTLSLNAEIQLNFQQVVDLVRQLSSRQKKQLATILSSEEDYITKEEVVENIRDGLREVKLHKEGKIKLKSARELLNEL
jgi:hypothetical protein